MSSISGYNTKWVKSNENIIWKKYDPSTQTISEEINIKTQLLADRANFILVNSQDSNEKSKELSLLRKDIIYRFQFPYLAFQTTKNWDINRIHAIIKTQDIFIDIDIAEEEKHSKDLTSFLISNSYVDKKKITRIFFYAKSKNEKDSSILFTESKLAVVPTCASNAYKIDDLKTMEILKDALESYKEEMFNENLFPKWYSSKQELSLKPLVMVQPGGRPLQPFFNPLMPPGLNSFPGARMGVPSSGHMFAPPHLIPLSQFPTQQPPPIFIHPQMPGQISSTIRGPIRFSPMNRFFSPYGNQGKDPINLENRGATNTFPQTPTDLSTISLDSSFEDLNALADICSESKTKQKPAADF